jgi:two-component sensor histidine kinase
VVGAPGGGLVAGPLSWLRPASYNAAEVDVTHQATMNPSQAQNRQSRGNWGLFTALAATGWVLAGVLEVLLWSALAPVRGVRVPWREVTLTVASFWGLAALLAPVLVWAIRRAPFEPGRRWRSAARHVVVLACLIVVHSLLREVWLIVLVSQATPKPSKFLAAIPSIITGNMGGAMLVYLVTAGAVNMWDYYQRYRERERVAALLELERAQLRASLSEARLEALQRQLQPHFLFNALHAISTLILKGETRGANEMLSHLSRFLRMTLDRADSPTVPLATELETLDAYLRIQKERFRDRLRVEMSIDDRALPAAVPHLVFQPLVENSIRHGIASESGTGTIVVRAAVAGERLELEIEDDGRGLDQGEEASRGVGLDNIHERLEQLYPGQHEFSLSGRPGRGVRARIVIPFRPAGRVDAPSGE